MAKTHSQSNSVAWHEINWKKVQRYVLKLQKRIYRASIKGDIKKMRQLQKTLTNSYYAKLLAVRKITQDNQGKKTAGVDRIHTLTPPMRLKLANNLKLNHKSNLIKRVYIPKANGERRPLGIPTMYDRAAQTLVKMALEPEWEARFEPNSYGFRPGRSAHDAIEAIFNSIRSASKYVLDADIAKCFDCINHTKLIKKLNTYPKLKKQIKAWLKAGIMENGEKLFPEYGTPQGGSISPLLANIALHGMENAIKEYAASWKGYKKNNMKSLSLIRYADDFVIIHSNLNVIKQCKIIISDWLRDIGLELKQEKTGIVHTLINHEENLPGFDFLGFNIRQHKVGKYHSGKNNLGEPLGFKTIIKPSKESVKKQYNKIAQIIDTHKNQSQEELIKKLNPVIRGWANYFKTVCSKKTYKTMDALLFKKLWSWSNKRHPNKPKGWIKHKYWHNVELKSWTFCSKNIILAEYSKIDISRHTKVKGIKSPYDGDDIYWAERMSKHPTMPSQKSKLLKKQKGKCNWCKLYFKTGEAIELDHIIPTVIRKDNRKDNFQLLHKHCHDTKTRQDLKLIEENKETTKARQQTKNRVNKMNWKWVNDMLICLDYGTHTEPIWREAVCGESRKHGFEDESVW